MDTTVTIRNERSSWLVQISAPRAEHDLILVALGAVVGVYYGADEGIYRVAGHRELVLRRFAEQVRERGGSVTWSRQQHAH